MMAASGWPECQIMIISVGNQVNAEQNKKRLPHFDLWWLWWFMLSVFVSVMWAVDLDAGWPLSAVLQVEELLICPFSMISFSRGDELSVPFILPITCCWPQCGLKACLCLLYAKPHFRTAMVMTLDDNMTIKQLLLVCLQTVFLRHCCWSSSLHLSSCLMTDLNNHYG